jgi:hypothetical protein
MNKNKLTALALAGLLSASTGMAFAGSPGPTDPVDKAPKGAASGTGMNTDGATPAAKGTSPGTKGMDPAPKTGNDSGPGTSGGMSTDQGVGGGGGGSGGGNGSGGAGGKGGAGGGS